MSHFTTIRTVIADGDLLEQALSDLGLRYERGSLTISGWRGRHTQAEFRIFTDAKDYDIGLRQSGGTYELVADWWGVRGFQEKSFGQRLERSYAVAATKRTLTEQGYSLVSEQQEQDGQVRLVLRRYA